MGNEARELGNVGGSAPRKLGKLTFRLRAETDKRADIFSRLDGFIERASRAPIENDENWTGVHMRKKEREKSGGGGRLY